MPFPVTSPVWNLPGAYSLEFDIAEREEWYSQNTSATVAPFALPEEHSQFDSQNPEIFRSLAAACLPQSSRFVLWPMAIS